MNDRELLVRELNQLHELLVSEASALSFQERGKIQKRVSHIQELVTLYEEQEKVAAEIILCKNALLKDDELSDLYRDELPGLEERLSSIIAQIELILYPPDERENRNVFIEIRAGAGGQEAGLFACELYEMYEAYAEKKRWDMSIVDISKNDVGGVRELIAYCKGKSAYRFLQFESGVHRVQRVPVTESAGRIHTSTVTVAVLPEADDVDVTINQNDHRIDVYRSSGAGGQHVNTTDSAVRITHLPTGLVVTCQDERSQIKNKAKAMKVLQARLFEAERERQEVERHKDRKQQVGTGDRSEKIRTYNFPQNRVTDHRIGLTLKKLDYVMKGDLEELFGELISDAANKRRTEAVLAL